MTCVLVMDNDLRILIPLLEVPQDAVAPDATPSEPELSEIVRMASAFIFAACFSTRSIAEDEEIIEIFLDIAEAEDAVLSMVAVGAIADSIVLGVDKCEDALLVLPIGFPEVFDFFEWHDGVAEWHDGVAEFLRKPPCVPPGHRAVP